MVHPGGVAILNLPPSGSIRSHSRPAKSSSSTGTPNSSEMVSLSLT